MPNVDKRYARVDSTGKVIDVQIMPTTPAMFVEVGPAVKVGMVRGGSVEPTDGFGWRDTWRPGDAADYTRSAQDRSAEADRIAAAAHEPGYMDTPVRYSAEAERLAAEKAAGFPDTAEARARAGVADPRTGNNPGQPYSADPRTGQPGQYPAGQPYPVPGTPGTPGTNPGYSPGNPASETAAEAERVAAAKAAAEPNSRKAEQERMAKAAATKRP